MINFGKYIDEMASNIGPSKENIFSKKSDFEKLDIKGLKLINDKLYANMSI